MQKQIVLLCLATLWASLVCISARAETKVVVVEGSSEMCYSRAIALPLAVTSATNNGHKECFALEKGVLGNLWSFKGVKFSGYTQCFQCGSGPEVRCTVTQAAYYCVNMDMENQEKAAKARAARDAAQTAAQMKAANEKAGRELKQKQDEAKAAEARAKKDLAQQRKLDARDQLGQERSAQEVKSAGAGAIDDAFARLEGRSAPNGRGAKAPADKSEAISNAFAKMETEKAEQERVRMVAAKQLKAREEAAQFCAEAMKSEKQCLADACKRTPDAEICTDSRRDPNPPCGPGKICLVIPSYTCYATGPNPAFAEWKSCINGAASKCARNGRQADSLEACIQRHVEGAR
jgi:hypothetical protein